jgi:SYP5 family syntaxin
MAFSDSWLKEFEEAMKLAEDISSRLRERELILSSGGDPAHLVSSTRRKITVLGTCLDRLESLLQNPPDKPIL